jgi:hypothetical protein
VRARLFRLTVKGKLMKASRLFWGVFFVVFGLFLLLDKLDVYTIEWGFIWKMWPVLLILWGISIIAGGQRSRWVAAAVFGMGFGLVLVGIFTFGWVDVLAGNGEVRYQELSEPFDPSITHASFVLQSGAGAFTLKETTEQLVEASVGSTFGDYYMRRDQRHYRERVYLSLDEHGIRWRPGKTEHRAALRLNPKPVWDLDIETGAAKVDFDLSPFEVEQLTIEAGAADVRIRLGERGAETRMTIDAGASSVRIWVPESAGCEVRMDTGLTSKHLSNFERINSGMYRTPNFASADRRIMISVDAGLSSITVNRY